MTISDPKLRERLCFLAGRGFSGLGFKDYFERCGVMAGLHSQAALLAGYCEVQARTEPEAAVIHFGGMGPEDKRRLGFAFHAMTVYGDEDGLFLDMMES